MERIWLKQYPAGVPRRYRRDPIHVSRRTVGRKLLPSFSERKAFICMDKSDQLSRSLDENVAGARGPICRARACQRVPRVALMMPNVLQYPVSTAAVFARLAIAVVQRQSAVHPRASLNTSSRISGAEAIIVLENFATHRAAG